MTPYEQYQENLREVKGKYRQLEQFDIQLEKQRLRVYQEVCEHDWVWHPGLFYHLGDTYQGYYCNICGLEVRPGNNVPKGMPNG